MWTSVLLPIEKRGGIGDGVVMIGNGSDGFLGAVDGLTCRFLYLTKSRYLSFDNGAGRIPFLPVGNVDYSRCTSQIMPGRYLTRKNINNLLGGDAGDVLEIFTD